MWYSGTHSIRTKIRMLTAVYCPVIVQNRNFEGSRNKDINYKYMSKKFNKKCLNQVSVKNHEGEQMKNQFIK